MIKRTINVYIYLHIFLELYQELRIKLSHTHSREKENCTISNSRIDTRIYKKILFQLRYFKLNHKNNPLFTTLKSSIRLSQTNPPSYFFLQMCKEWLNIISQALEAWTAPLNFTFLIFQCFNKKKIEADTHFLPINIHCGSHIIL